MSDSVEMSSMGDGSTPKEGTPRTKAESAGGSPAVPDAVLGGAAAACACICCVGIIVAFVLLVIAPWGYVNYDEYGLLYHKIQKRVVSREPYEMGRYYIGVDHTFIKFNRTHHNVDLVGAQSVVVRVTDGQMINVEVSFQYALQKEHLYDIYINYKNKEYFAVQRVAGPVIRDVAATFTSDDFVVNRRHVGEVLEANMRVALEARKLHLVDLQLRRVDLPSSLDNRFVDIQLDIQEERYQRAELDVDVIRINTETQVSYLQAEKENLLGKISTETNVMKALLTRNVSLERNRGLRERQTVVVARDTSVALYKQETENQRLVLEANTTVIDAISEQQARAISLTSDRLKAEHEATKRVVRAHAEALRLETVESARVAGRRLREEAEVEAFANVTNLLGMTAEEGLHLQFIEAISKHRPAHLLFDFFTPDALYLDGQKDSFYRRYGNETAA